MAYILYVRYVCGGVAVRCTHAQTLKFKLTRKHTSSETVKKPQTHVCAHANACIAHVLSLRVQGEETLVRGLAHVLGGTHRR